MPVIALFLAALAAILIPAGLYVASLNPGGPPLPPRVDPENQLALPNVGFAALDVATANRDPASTCQTAGRRP